MPLLITDDKAEAERFNETHGSRAMDRSYGTYAGPIEQPAAAKAVDSWEDEGGALDPPQVVMPDGVTSKTVRHYHVGSYVYQDLDLAVAEHLRQLSAANED